ncbi:MAG: hypothetical protein CTY31_10600 [Hyphomicrobium sp.]|nr:MAG: hypothetical protein CTY31_10600 [Hyphomicrobium sp.]
MKFVYVDESGDAGQGDVFVMAGLLVDAYRLRKHTEAFDEKVSEFLAKHPKAPKELKTKALINGNDGWSKIDADDRKLFLTAICDLAVECARIYAVALSFAEFKKAIAAGHGHPFKASYWLGASMFLSALVQQKMQCEKRNKGLTVLICDDNKMAMANLSDGLYEADPWFDPIFQEKKKGKKNGWAPRNDDDRFDHIVNTAFAIKSHHSSLIQVADAVSYIYRRHLELKSQAEAYEGEKPYFEALAAKLDGKRARLGRTPGGPCIDFYQAARHKEWAL